MPVMLVTNVHPDVMKANRLYDVTLKNINNGGRESSVCKISSFNVKLVLNGSRLSDSESGQTHCFMETLSLVFVWTNLADHQFMRL